MDTPALTQAMAQFGSDPQRAAQARAAGLAVLAANQGALGRFFGGLDRLLAPG